MITNEKILMYAKSYLKEGLKGIDLTIEKNGGKADKSLKRLRTDLQVEIQCIEEKLKQSEWIATSEALPSKIEPVIITWVNRDPAPYYQDIKDKPDVAVAYYHNNNWWWFSKNCEDYLFEYGESQMDIVDKGIEIIAWMPLPRPYKEGK